MNTKQILAQWNLEDHAALSTPNDLFIRFKEAANEISSAGLQEMANPEPDPEEEFAKTTGEAMPPPDKEHPLRCEADFPSFVGRRVQETVLGEERIEVAALHVELTQTQERAGHWRTEAERQRAAATRAGRKNR